MGTKVHVGHIALTLAILMSVSCGREVNSVPVGKGTLQASPVGPHTALIASPIPAAPVKELPSASSQTVPPNATLAPTPLRVPVPGNYKLLAEGTSQRSLGGGPFSYSSEERLRVERLSEDTFTWQRRGAGISDYVEHRLSTDGLYEIVATAWDMKTHSTKRCVHTPPKKLIAFPVVVGEKWQQPINCEGYSDAETLGFELLRIGGTDVETVVVQSNYSGSDGKQFYKYWFSPKHGLLVREEWVLNHDIDERDRRSVLQVLELSPTG